MVKYIIVHNKHEGCYDFQYYEDAATKMRLTSITINPPKIFMFESREQAQDFFEEYINDVDVIDVRCKKGEEVEHIDYCTCGIIELDEEENPILFYNKKNQIFLMEHGPQIFIPPQELKEDIKNLNLTNRLIRKAKSLSREQRKRYIELGKYCEDCSMNDNNDDELDSEKEDLQKKLQEQKQLQEHLQEQLQKQYNEKLSLENAKDTKESKDTKETKNTKEIKETKETKESKETKNTKEKKLVKRNVKKSSKNSDNSDNSDNSENKSN
jgi:hypothetical protein